jgi:hypothetical protein
MRYQENFNNPMDEFKRFFNTMIQQLFTNTLKVEGETVNMPSDRELDYKMKYAVDEESRSFTFKVSWDNEVQEDD